MGITVLMAPMALASEVSGTAAGGSEGERSKTKEEKCGVLKKEKEVGVVKRERRKRKFVRNSGV
jgi:hypothetical protein